MKWKKWKQIVAILVIIFTISGLSVFADNNDATLEVTDPGVTDPGVTDPGVTDPEVTDPGVTDPEVTDPGVTDPVKKTPETKDKKQTTKPRAVESVLDIFPDSNLARAVANKLNKTSVNDVVTQAELDSIIFGVDFSNKDIKSLVGISRFSKLIELNISNNQISDITPLASMKDMS
ncbi:hypothetical protein A7B70_14750, partial [Listeria monocytogenes]|nr:hypothetical protein [Listeria monocytogenes]